MFNSYETNYQRVFNVGKTMPFLPPIFLGMVTIPPIEMVMTVGWFVGLFYPHYRILIGF
jgi:prepilin signal peptidase PulO-like enzyme (type II secretory pathway)